MANEVATTDLADGLQAQAWRVLSLHPSTTSEIARRLGDDASECLDAAIGKVEYDLRPVPAGPARAEWDKAIDERLRRLAVKVLPTARRADTAEWRKAMWEALSDLPAMISLTAARRAIHRAFRFVGEIEPAIREIAAELSDERKLVLAALRRHRAEIDRALCPAQALPSAEPDRLPTDDEIRALSKTAMWPDLKAMGLSLGSFDDDDLRRALGDVSQCSEYVPAESEAA